MGDEAPRANVNTGDGGGPCTVNMSRWLDLARYMEVSAVLLLRFFASLLLRILAEKNEMQQLQMAVCNPRYGHYIIRYAMCNIKHTIHSVIAQSQDGCTNEVQNTDGITQQTRPDGGMQWKATHHKHNKQLHMADALVTVASSCIRGW